MRKLHVYIVAAEKSGDELGARLATSLRSQMENNIVLSGIGGSAMQGVGLTSPIDISPLSILGFLEGLKSYPVIMQRVAETTDAIINSNADACILIDSWGFMMRVAQRLKKKNYAGKIIKYVAPQVWAMREGRSKTLARGVDHLLTIHSFDAPYFTRYGLDVSYVGNPVFDENYDTGDAQSLRTEYDIAKSVPVLVLLFGSRLSEIQTLAAPFADAVGRLKNALPELVIVAPVADTIATDVMAAAAEHENLQDVILLNESRKLDCFALADASIACSGTVTTQLASAVVPSVVAYKLNWLTYALAKHMYKPDYVSIVNIAADAELMPEFIQNECTGENLARAALIYLDNKEAQVETQGELRAAIQAMRKGSGNTQTGKTSERAASTILKLLN